MVTKIALVTGTPCGLAGVLVCKAVFIKINLARVLRKISIAPEDVSKTAVITSIVPVGRMSFGPRNTSQAFMRINLAEMVTERRVDSPCDEDTTRLQLQDLLLTTGNSTIFCNGPITFHQPFVSPPSFLPSQPLT
nr:unnamed protein product [Spirometra erinaceieuropaei]